MAEADALVSKVLDMLISTIVKEIEQEVRLVVGVKKQVRMLTKNLQSIKGVLTDADRRQWKDVSVQLWVDRLKDVSFDIEDVLDEWSFAIMKSQCERDDLSPKHKRKVWSFILSPCFCFREVGIRRDIAVKITELNETLDDIASEKDKYGFLSLEGNNKPVQRPITTSVIDISEVKGREDDVEKFVKLLLTEDSERPKLHPISIVGMGGIGKTTLAKLVYNDERVKTHFDKRVWVCVSEPFDEIRIAKEILEFIGNATPNLVSLPNIMENIQKSIEGKKVLVVLDDVWNEDPKKWKQLEYCLKSGLLGSSIVVTTRKENVGRIMGCSKSDIFHVGLLSEEESWELFSMIAFFGRSSGERASLEKIGREVVERCKGLPLAIKAIAGLLQLKEGRREWRNVLDSELWNWEGFQSEIAPVLWLSYYDLPLPLKQCFLYCAVFPKDYRMEKDELICHWIAHGYIKETESKDMEIVGEEYFQNLAMRSFFQDVEVEGFITKCKMHDIVHDFAQLLVKKKCHSIEVSDGHEEISFVNDSFSQSLRHLSICHITEVRCPDSFYNLKKLRSLIVLGPMWKFESFFGVDLQKVFNGFNVLRSLKLRNCGIEEVPSNINRLIHLRELELSENEKLKELPNTVWELYNLQILNLESTGIQSVKGIDRLNGLRCLRNIGTECCLPKEVVRLSGLRRVSCVNIDVNNDEMLSLKHLKNFNQLSGLMQISWLKRGDRDVEDAKQAQLMDKEHITQLWLDFGIEESTSKQDEELVEALNVPPNLESLAISCYMGSITPEWFHSLTAVKMVWLSLWERFEHLPPLGKLPCLEDLQLFKFYKVEKVGGEFLGMDEMMKSKTVPFFPKLKSLKFYEFTCWKEWNGVDVDGDEEMLIMPSLVSLKVTFCENLKALPNFILKKTSLKLDIEDCGALTGTNLHVEKES